MRTFGKDTPEFFEFKIAGKKKTYRIPTQASISYDFTNRIMEIAAMEDQNQANAAAIRLQFDILKKYIGDEAADFPTDTVAEIFTAWANFTTETTGLDQGELQGSPAS